MVALWEVVGGGDKGGILVREGEAFDSAQCKDRLSTGAIVEELELKGERLHFKLPTGKGTGPKEGWVSLKLKDKELMKSYTKVERPADVWPEGEDLGGPGPAGKVATDKALVEKISKLADKHRRTHERPDNIEIYCPKYKFLGYPLNNPKFRVICFHNAGSAESNYTSPGSPFMKWVKENKEQIEVCAIDFPGRDKLLKHPKHDSIDPLVEELMSVMWEKMKDDVPYAIWSHSVGTWVAFEYIMLARKCGFRMPSAAFFNAFPAPHMPRNQRTWHKSRDMTDKEFRDELYNWDNGHFEGAGKVVFDEPAWTDTWKPPMVSDFRLFDEYEFPHKDAPKFDFPIHAWHMEGEYYNNPDQIKMWGDWTTAKFDHQTLAEMGHLTCFYKPQFKIAYFTKMVDCLKEYTKKL